MDVATYFMEMYPHVLATGDVDEWQRLSAVDCVFCHAVVADLDALADQGHHREGGAVTVGYSVVSAGAEAGSYSVGLSMNEAPARVVDSHGEAIGDWTEPQSYVASVLLVHDGASWAIQAVEPAPADG